MAREKIERIEAVVGIRSPIGSRSPIGWKWSNVTTKTGSELPSKLKKKAHANKIKIEKAHANKNNFTRNNFDAKRQEHNHGWNILNGLLTEYREEILRTFIRKLLVSKFGKKFGKNSKKLWEKKFRKFWRKKMGFLLRKPCQLFKG